MDYEADIRIDETALDVECLEQPRMFLRYSKHSAECRKAMDLAKEAADVIKAEVDNDIRANPDQYDLPKVTEASVTNAVLVDKDYRKAQKKFFAARYEYEMSLAIVRAFEQRKSALEYLVKLHGMSYFAGPKVPRDISKEYDNREEYGQRRGRATNAKVKMTRRKATDSDE